MKNVGQQERERGWRRRVGGRGGAHTHTRRGTAQRSLPNRWRKDQRHGKTPKTALFLSPYLSPAAGMRASMERPARSVLLDNEDSPPALSLPDTYAKASMTAMRYRVSVFLSISLSDAMLHTFFSSYRRRGNGHAPTHPPPTHTHKRSLE